MATSLWDSSQTLTAYFSYLSSSFLVNVICWISLALGIFFSLPVTLFIVYDIILWIWRIHWSYFFTRRNSATVDPPEATRSMTDTAATSATDGIRHTSKRR